MTTATIETIIRDLNGERRNEFELVDISPTVDLAHFTFINDPNPHLQARRKKWSFFLVKGEDAKYAAAVYLMEPDLHVVVLEECRKRGLLVQPMRDFILPYLMQWWGQIKITIDRNENDGCAPFSEKLALKLGFVKVDNSAEPTEYLYKPSN